MAKALILFLPTGTLPPSDVLLSLGSLLLGSGNVFKQVLLARVAQHTPDEEGVVGHRVVNLTEMADRCGVHAFHSFVCLYIYIMIIFK